MLAKEQNDFGAAQNAQLAREAEPMCIGAEQLITKGMKGFDWGRGVAVRNEAIDAPLHLLCRALRKGECQDLFWLGTLFGDQPGNATCDDLGLASARTGDDEEWPLTVRDSGEGIPKEHLPHVFDRYWTVKEGNPNGTGLGLYITQGIVEAHGGRIVAESEPGQGSEFRFTVPRLD